MNAAATLVHTSSREASARDCMARVSAAGRVQAEREAREGRERASFLASGTRHFGGGEYFCFICSRCTDHYAEHSEEQISAWRAEYLRHA